MPIFTNVNCKTAEQLCAISCIVGFWRTKQNGAVYAPLFQNKLLQGIGNSVLVV